MKKWDKFDFTIPHEKLEIRFINPEQIKDSFLTYPAPREGVLYKKPKDRECQICKNFIKLRSYIDVPVYDIDQRPEIDPPMGHLQLWSNTKLHDFVVENKLKYLHKQSETKYHGVPS